MRKRIAVDMDEVIADTLRAQLAWLDHEHGLRWEPSQLSGRRLGDLLPAAVSDSLEALLHDGAFFGTLAAMRGSQDVLRRMSSRFDIFVATAAMEYPGSFFHKFEWLRRYFAFIPPDRIVFCGDKGIIHADVLIDDNASHLRRFAGKGVLFAAPHNHEVSGFEVVRNWAEVEELSERW
jgi:5'(3')-deoxyribonucleotidase